MAQTPTSVYQAIALVVAAARVYGSLPPCTCPGACLAGIDWLAAGIRVPTIKSCTAHPHRQMQPVYE